MNAPGTLPGVLTLVNDAIPTCTHLSPRLHTRGRHCRPENINYEEILDLKNDTASLRSAQRKHVAPQPSYVMHTSHQEYQDYDRRIVEIVSANDN